MIILMKKNLFWIFLVLLSTTVFVSGQQENIIINNNVSNIINRWSNHPVYSINNNDNDDSVSSTLSSPKHLKLLSSPLITHQTSAIQSSSSSSLNPSYQNQFINVAEFTANVSKRFDFICGTQFGYYRDPENCASYYICSFGIPLHKNCSKGLYFSIRLQICDWPANVPCEQGLCSLFPLNFFSLYCYSKKNIA